MFYKGVATRFQMYMYRVLLVFDNTLLTYMHFSSDKKSVGRVVRFVCKRYRDRSSRPVHSFVEKFYSFLSIREKRVSVTGDGISNKYWLTASVMHAQCS